MQDQDRVIPENKYTPETYKEAVSGSRFKNIRWMYVAMVMSIVVAAASLLGVYKLYQYQLAPAANSAEEQRFITIDPGMSSAQVASTLYDQGLIRSPLAFRLYGRLNNVSHMLQAGVYGLSPSQSVAEITEVITDGDVADTEIRIPSGSQLDDVIEILSDAGFSRTEIDTALSSEYDSDILRDKPEEAGLEGYLFPDTYHIPADAEASDFVEMALSHTEEQLDQRVIEGWQEQGLDIHQGLTLASIIQKESPIEDMPAIAGVFINRLDQGLKLESDATVNYVLGTNKLQPSSDDVDISHPYNTYRVDGLPPGPINNPELGAIEATAEPEDHDFLFFLNKPSGETVFSRSFEEHLDKQRRYLD